MNLLMLRVPLRTTRVPLVHLVCHAALRLPARGGRSSLTVFGTYSGVGSAECAALDYPGFPMNQIWEIGLAQQRKGRVMTNTIMAAGIIVVAGGLSG